MSKQDEASLILKLYELRRDPVMRDARNWFAAEFHPKSVAEMKAEMFGAKSSYVRMVMSYWEMAAALVNHGAIDLTLFNETNGEQFMVFSRIEPLLPELRAELGPQVLSSLEKLIDATPDGRERSARTRAMMAKVAEMRAQRANSPNN